MTRARLWLLLLAAGSALALWLGSRPSRTGVDSEDHVAPLPSASAASGRVAALDAANAAPATEPLGGGAPPDVGGLGTPRVTPERALREVRALVDKGSIGAARALAERYLRELPECPEARQIQGLTGVHPHP